MDRYLPIDEEGFVWFDGQRLDDAAYGAELIRNLRVGERGRIETTFRGQTAFVEAFDAPLVARHVTKIPGGRGHLDLAYGERAEFEFETLSVDEWDRFHGVTTNGVPFVFSRGGQYEFFDLLDGFDDDSITSDGRTIRLPTWLRDQARSEAASFWSEHYQRETTGWDLAAETPALGIVLPQLKLSRSRILVPGTGRGHDAAYLARQGHAVTAVDFSEEAIARAKNLYGDVEGLDFVRADVFDLPDSFRDRFDVIFEHTCYCAINPRRRSELVEVWRRCLRPNGHLLGIFFAAERANGPPFGGSEWELRARLAKNFHSLFWTRWRHSVPNRRGLEVVIYARKA